MSKPDQTALVERGKRVLALEADAVRRIADGLGAAFARAIELLAAARGRIVVSGVGKSGLIARKIAATFTSTGTPAAFLHPVDSLHGDLGIVGATDVAIILSKSGSSDELFGLVNQLRRLGVPIIALTGEPDSPLGRQATVVLDAAVSEEACPETLAPTASTTVALALGDALAVTLLEVKGFRREDFAALHPGGALGRKLLLRVADVMLTGDLPTLAPDRPMRECVVVLAEKRGTAAVVDGQGSLVGVVTAGDLTRLMERSDRFLDIPVRDVMTKTPKTTTADQLAGAAVRLMEQHGIMALPVLDGGRKVVGIVHLHDLMKAGAVCLMLLFNAVLASCGGQGAQPTATQAVLDSADQVLIGMTHFITETGLQRARVRADTAYFFSGTQSAEMRTVHITFYDVRGAESSVLTAREGTYHWRTQDMEGRGKVVVRTTDGRTLRSEVMRYNQARNEVSSDRAFVFEGPGGQHIEGEGFTSDPEFKNLVAIRPSGTGGQLRLPNQ